MARKMNIWGYVGVLVAAVVVLAVFNGFTQGMFKSKEVFADSAETSAVPNVISVSGQGEITVEPDVAYVNFGIQSRAKTANEAQVDNAQQFAKVEKVLYDQFKLDKKDVQTSNFSVWPEYTYPDNKAPVINGYVVSNTVKVTYRDIAKLGQLLDAVSKAGVNQVNGIQFGTEKSAEYELQVLDKAMDNAKAKAEVLVKHTNRKLKGIIGIQQNGGGSMPIPYTNYSVEKVMAMSDSVSNTSISGGQLTITANVSVQFEY